MKGLIILLVAGFLFFYMSGGGDIINDVLNLDDESKLEGEWDSVTEEGISYTFYESKRFIKVEDEIPKHGTWSLKTETLVFNYADNETEIYTYTFKPDANLIVLCQNNQTSVLEKKDDSIKEYLPFASDSK